MPILAATLLLAAPRSCTPRPSWSARLRLAGTTLTLQVENEAWAGTALRVRRGSRVLAKARDELYYDPSPRPRLWLEEREAMLVYAADPGAGSGQFASVWRIASGGRRLVRLGLLRNADLREWRSRGIVREIRAAKYATKDVLRIFPRAFDEERYRGARFVSTYHYDRRSERLRLVGVRLATEAEACAWPYAVRFPKR